MTCRNPLRRGASRFGVLAWDATTAFTPGFIGGRGHALKPLDHGANSCIAFAGRCRLLKTGAGGWLSAGRRDLWAMASAAACYFVAQ